MEVLRKAVIELLKTAPGHIKGHWSELDEVVKAIAQPEQKPWVSLTDEDTKILEAVRRELSRENRNGDAPGHLHQIPGIWDSDNGDIAGKPCAWCLTWKKFTAIIDREAKLKEFNNGISQ